MKAIVPRAGALVVLTLSCLVWLAACSPASPFTSTSDAAPSRDGASSPAIVVQPATDAGWAESGVSDDGDATPPPGDDAASASGDGRAEAAPASGVDAMDATPFDAQAAVDDGGPAADGVADAQADAASPPCDAGYHPCGGVCAADTDVTRCGAACTPCPPAPADAAAICAPSGSDYTCSWACNAGFAACAGTCVDLQNDARNCGACGHECTPGACRAGVCQPWVANPSASASRIACDGTHLAWADVGSMQVEERPADGSPATTAWLSGPTSDSPNALVMGGPLVVWTTTDSTGKSSLWEARKDATVIGGLAQSGLGPVVGLAVDGAGSFAYVNTPQGTSVTLRACDLTGLNPCTALTTFSSSQVGPLVVDDHDVFWADPGNARVSRYRLSDGALSTIASAQAGLGPIALDAVSVYWVTNEGSTFTVSATGKQSSGGATRTVASGSDSALAVVSDGANLYVGTSAGRIQTVPVTGGALTTLVTLSSKPANELVYATGALYWADWAALYGLRVP